MECIFVNRIINQSTAYNKCNNIDDQYLYIDKRNNENVALESKLIQLVKDNECRYILYVIYENNNVIGKEGFKVVEISIYELSFMIDTIKRKYLYSTTNKHYIQYLLSINQIAIDNKGQLEYYDFLYDSDFTSRLFSFIGSIRNNHKEIDGDGIDYNLISQYNDIYKICFSNAYKRLQDKAQVFTSAKGDHYRNRLIHTNEVATISVILLNKINKILNNNHIDYEKVVAIALGHDIGHTPFGHQGERTLDEIIKLSEISIIKNSGQILYDDVGGFKHNIQSVRVLTMKDNEDYNYNKTNINSEIIEGILKHTKYNYNNVIKLIDKEYIKDLNVSIDDDENNDGFSLQGESFNDREILYNANTNVPLYMYKDFKHIYDNTHLSGEIVGFADEIAQRCSDIEDAIRSGFVDFKKLCMCLKDMDYKEIIENIDLEKFNKKMNLKILCENIVNYYTDVLSTTLEKSKFKHIYYDKRLFNFNRIISEYVKNKLISSNEIARFDSMGNTIVSSLFKSYYYNPRLLNVKVIKKMFFEMIDNPILINNAVYFSEMGKEYINEVIKRYTNITYNDTLLLKFFKTILLSDEIVYKNIFLNIDEFETVNTNSNIDYYLKEFTIDVIKDNIKDLSDLDMVDLTNCFKYYSDNNIKINYLYLIQKLVSYEQQKIIIRAICDYISGMTDTFAMSEYKNLE